VFILRCTSHQILYDLCAPHPGYIDYLCNRHKKSGISGWPDGFHGCAQTARFTDEYSVSLNIAPHGTFDFLTE